MQYFFKCHIIYFLEHAYIYMYILRIQFILVLLELLLILHLAIFSKKELD